MNNSEHNSEYIGRFAPSPTGLLHLGSLMAAMASYCDAMKNNGQWFVRIEDLDPPREVKGATENIISTLREYGFEFRNNLMYQSHRSEIYHQVMEKLEEQASVYYCSCSRTELKNQSIENHHCRKNIKKPSNPYNIKCKVPNRDIKFFDGIQGYYEKNLFRDCGDFVVKRKDGLFSYQLAVVIDDYHQGITNIVRGVDLLESTPWQIYLNSILGFKLPCYAHIPVLVNDLGQKLSKQTYAKEIDKNDPLESLLKAFSFLNQTQFTKKPHTIDQFWSHAIHHWDINKIAKVNAFKV